MAHILPLVGGWKPPTMWIKPKKKKNFTDKQLTMLIDLGFRTALNCGIDCSNILIRSGFHDTTRIAGKAVVDRWHVSYRLKHPELFNDEYIAAHGYTPGEWQPFLTDSSQDMPKLDSTVNPRGNAVWPKDAICLPKHLYPADMEGMRSKFIRRGQAKLKQGSNTAWSTKDPADVSAQFLTR